MNKRSITIICFACMLVTLVAQVEKPVIYQGLLERGARDVLTQEALTYFEAMIESMSVSVEEREIYGCYRMIMFPNSDSELTLRINVVDGEMQFSMDDSSLSYNMISDTQFYLKHGLIIYNTTDGIYGKIVYPDGSIDSIIFLELIE